MTIYEIKRNVEASGSHYFSMQTMKFWGQALSKFRIKKISDTTYMIHCKTKFPGVVSIRYYSTIDRKLHHTIDSAELLTKQC
jgi:hypothetical protein